MKRPSIGRIVHVWCPKYPSDPNRELICVPGIVSGPCDPAGVVEEITVFGSRFMSGINIFHKVRYSEEPALLCWTWPRKEKDVE